MKLFPLTLNLALQFPVYEYLADLLSLTYDTEANKTTEKSNIKNQVETTLAQRNISPPFVDIYIFRRPNKQYYFVPLIPTENKNDLKSISQYKEAIKNKSLKIKYKLTLKAPDTKTVTTINSIIENESNYGHFKIDVVMDSDSETDLTGSQNAVFQQDHDSEENSIHDADPPSVNPPAPSQPLAQLSSGFLNVPNPLTSPSHSMSSPPTQRHENEIVKTDLNQTNNSVLHTHNTSSPAPRQVMVNTLPARLPAEHKLKLTQYADSVKAGDTIDEWLSQNIFILTLADQQAHIPEEQKIALLLGALSGEIRSQVISELQRQHLSGGLSLDTFKNAIRKITKKSAAETTRSLNRLNFDGGDIQAFYNQILNLSKKLVKNDDVESAVNLADGQFRSKMYKTNQVFQLSEKAGQDLVDLAVEISQLSSVPVTTQTNAYQVKPGQKHGQKMNHHQNHNN